jgi:hypothetical protein
MRLPWRSLYFALALSGLVCGTPGAEARTIRATGCFAQTQSVRQYRFFAASIFCVQSGGCTCTVTFCPALCRPLPLSPFFQRCTFVSNCFQTGTTNPIQCAPNAAGTAILCGHPF